MHTLLYTNIPLYANCAVFLENVLSRLMFRCLFKYIDICITFDIILHDNSIPQFRNKSSQCVLSRSLKIFGKVPLYVYTLVELMLRICSFDRCSSFDVL